MEVWKDVKGYEGLYQVSKLGRVRNQNHKILSPAPRNGYLRVQLRKKCKFRSFAIHRLVAIAFLSNDKGYTEVNHKDEDKANNRVDNLEWCDRSYNCRYGDRTAKIIAKTSRPVLMLDKATGEVLREFKSTSEAGRYGYNSSHVAECCNNKRKSAYGYKWKYKTD